MRERKEVWYTEFERCSTGVSQHAKRPLASETRGRESAEIWKLLEASRSPSSGCITPVRIKLFASAEEHAGLLDLALGVAKLPEVIEQAGSF